jgi:flagellar motor switch protein FliM
MNLVSAERLTFAEFLVGVPELTYSASFRTLPIDAPVLIQVDMSLVFPMLDLVLGGAGSDSTDPRDLTEIEEEIFEAVVALIARDLQISWAPVVELSIQFEQRQPFAQMQNLLLPNEKVLSLNFEARIPNVRGAINIVFSGLIANALLHKLSVQGSSIKRTPSRDMRRRIRDRLLGSSFQTQLDLPPSSLSVREILDIKEDSVLVLPNLANEPVQLKIGGVPMFSASPVRQGKQKGARIQQHGWASSKALLKGSGE